MTNKTKRKFFEWLTQTFNDFYSVTDCNGDVQIFQHLPDTDHEKFWDTLDTTYPSFPYEGEPTEVEGVFFFGDDVNNICIEPFDNMIRHTEIGGKQ